MIPKSVQDFRREYRTHYIGRYYLGWVHFSFTLVSTTTVIALALWHVSKPTFVELMTIPLTFTYANLVEYFGHKGPMHHRVRFLEIIFQKHTVEHHRFYPHDA